MSFNAGINTNTILDRGARNENKGARSEQHDNANTLVTPLTWQTVLAMALPYMGPYVRTVAASAPSPEIAPEAFTSEGPEGVVQLGPGSPTAIAAARKVEMERVAKGQALIRARSSLLEREYHLLSLKEKAILLEVSGSSRGIRREEEEEGVVAGGSEVSPVRYG